MTKYIETTGKTEEAAIAAALSQLGMTRDQVSVEIITRPKTGFLGIGRVDAKVRVSYEAQQEPEPVKAQEPVKSAPAAPAEEKKPVRTQEPVKSAPKAEKPKAPKAPGADKPKGESAPKEESVSAAVQEQGAKEPAADRSGDIAAFLKGLLEHLEVEAQPEITSSGDGIYQVVLNGEELGALIGRRGETLDAIQQLTNYAVNHGQHSRVRVHVDCENYRAKREESLQRLARKTAGKAVKYRRNMMLEPMNAYERHVIHAELQDYHPNISTYSTGTDPNRRIVVAYNK